MNKNEWYRKIPKVDVLLDQEEVQTLISKYGRDVTMRSIRLELERLRIWMGKAENLEEEIKESLETDFVKELISKVKKSVENQFQFHMIPVLNGTGTILHTNLGRAPIGQRHMDQVAKIATGYSNLEYNLETGKRGQRYAHFEELLCEITGAESAMAVNNNAAAVMLILASLGKGKEIIVSRGELVEIGGKFRIPDVMEISGAKLKEVGTTNKTHLSDYENGISEVTGGLLKVHTSNYKIVGFTQSVPLEEVVELGKQREIPVIEDLGSGVFIDLGKYGMCSEPTVQASISKGVDVVCFSGDKLFGGPQAGIIVGKKKYIDKMKENQLTRALRIDKFTAAALEVVLQEYLSEETAIKNIPALHMLTKTLEEITAEVEMLAHMLKEKEGASQLHICVASCESQIGGGALPVEQLWSKGLVIKPLHMSVESYEEKMRQQPVPIIGRIMDGAIWLDGRTLDKKDFPLLCSELAGI